MSALLTPDGHHALALAAGVDDPDSLAAAQYLRGAVGPELAAAALTQEALRRRGVTKFGDGARDWFFTRDGLEQATRPRVSHWRAQRLLDLGIARVLDLGCGIGADARAFAEAGLEVVAVERDEVTAGFAAVNLAAYPQADVVTGDLLELVDPDSPATAGTALFIDPSRRTGAGRTWNVADFTPPWEFVQALLARDQVVVVKLGPGVPDRLLPDDAEVSFVADGADVVEASLWHGPGITARRRAVVLHPDRPVDSVEVGGEQHTMSDRDGELGRYLLEPHGAVIRAHASGSLPGAEQWWAPFPGVAYLASDQPADSDLVTSFEVREVLTWSEKTLRAWCQHHDIGTLEIKKRGIDIDPAVLRRRLKLRGTQSATVVLTPAVASGRQRVVALVVDRVVRQQQ